MESRAIKDWWEAQHRNKELLHLSGYRSRQIWGGLQIKDKVKPNITVLNIGIGLGHDTRDLARHGRTVHVLDISSLAIDSVRQVVSKGWLASEIDQLPPSTYDLAISHLVAQHMTNDDLTNQMTQVIRGLKPEGIFAIQFAYALNGESVGEDEVHLRGGAIVRTFDAFRVMMGTAKGIIIRSFIMGEYPKFNRGWYGVHIAKEKGKK